MELANQFGAGIIVDYFLQYLKVNSKFRFLSETHSSTYKAFVGFVAALITTVGIHYTFDYDVSTGGILTVDIPSISVMLHGVWDFAKQWAFQQASYDGFVRKGN